MELEAQYKTVTLKRSDLKLEGDGTAPGSATPSSPWDLGAATPMHPGGDPAVPESLGSCVACPCAAWGPPWDLQTPAVPGSWAPPPPYSTRWGS